MRSLAGGWGRLAAPAKELSVELLHYFFQTLESGRHHIREYPCTSSLLILPKKKKVVIRYKGIISLSGLCK